MKTIHHAAARLRLLPALVSVMMLAAPAALASEHRSDHDLARQALEQGDVLPLRTVLDQVEHQYGGQVIKIEFEHDDGRFIYKIRLLQADGRMAKLKVDATDGQVLKVKRKEPKHKGRY